jgi:hypothetical protein
VTRARAVAAGDLLTPHGPMGPLFKDLVKNHLQLYVAEKLWGYIKEAMITSSQLFWPEIVPDKCLHLFNMVEDAISHQVQIPNAKFQRFICQF